MSEKQKCPNCNGIGYILKKKEYPELYKLQHCNEVEVAIPCSACHGKGTVEIPFEESENAKY